MGYPTVFKAPDGYLLVQKEKDKVLAKTASGIIIPEAAQKKLRQMIYEVLSVGKGVQDTIEVGDFIVYKDSSVFLGANVIVKDSAVFIDEANGIVSVRQENVVGIIKLADLATFRAQLAEAEAREIAAHEEELRAREAAQAAREAAKEAHMAKLREERAAREAEERRAYEKNEAEKRMALGGAGALPTD